MVDRDERRSDVLESEFVLSEFPFNQFRSRGPSELGLVAEE